MKKNKERTYRTRNFSEQNLTNFKTALGGMRWNLVTEANNVDTACDEFWSGYSELFDLFFPFTTVRFNKNIHNKAQFMTEGILKSRSTKNRLFQESLSTGTPEANN